MTKVIFPKMSNYGLIWLFSFDIRYPKKPRENAYL